MDLSRTHRAESTAADNSAKEPLKVAVVEWASETDGIADVISDELLALGYDTSIIPYDGTISANTDAVFTFGPYGNYLRTVRHILNGAPGSSPVFIHWNTEGLPDLRLPWPVMRSLASARSWVGRLNDSPNSLVSNWTDRLTSPWEKRVLRFRYVGDYYYAYKKGLLHVFSDSSAVYAQLHRKHGLPTVVAPWGATKRWYADLDLDRDIDVLWLGQRGSKRRSRYLDRVRQELQPHGVQVHVVDNQENAFVYGAERTRLLNRAKITLNLTRTWYDDNFSRFAMAAPNRSLIVSEPMLPHCPTYEAGVHYVSAPLEKLSETILHFLRHDEERQRIVDSAHQLSTTKVSFRNSIAAIMDAVCSLTRRR